MLAIDRSIDRSTVRRFGVARLAGDRFDRLIDAASSVRRARGGANGGRARGGARATRRATRARDAARRAVASSRAIHPSKYPSIHPSEVQAGRARARDLPLMEIHRVLYAGNFESLWVRTRSHRTRIGFVFDVFNKVERHERHARRLHASSPRRADARASRTSHEIDLVCVQMTRILDTDIANYQ